MAELTHREDGNVEYELGRAAGIGKTLALPLELESGEHLRDAAFRAVKRNGFVQTNVVLELAGTRSCRSLAGMRERGAADELGRLVDVLGIRSDAQAIKEHLSKAPDTSRDWIEFFGVNVRRGHFVARRRVSPRSLRQRAAQKALWSLQPFNFDVVTSERLLDHCPVCQHELGWSRSFGVEFCDRCPSALSCFEGAVDLRDFPQPLVKADDEVALQFVTDLVDPEASHRRCGHAPHSDFADSGRGELFQLAIQIAGRLDKTPPGWGDSLTVSSIERAGRAILEWPKGFDELADSVEASAEDDVEGASGFDRLHVDRTLSAPVRKVLKQRLERRLRKSVTRKIDWSSSFAAVPQLLRPRRALRHCRTELKQLTTRPNDISPIEVAVVLLRNSPHARSIAADLGLPIPFLVDLFDAGMVPELHSLLEEVRGRHTSLWKSSLRDQISRTTRSSLTDDEFPLWSTSFALAHLNGQQWVRIFRAIVDGELTAARWLPSGATLVKQLHCADVGGLRSLLTSGAPASHADTVPLTQSDTSFAFGRSRLTVHNLVKNDMLPSNPTGLDIVELRKNWMFLTEISDLVSLDGKEFRNIRRLLGASGIARVSIGDTTLWSRVGVREFLVGGGDELFFGLWNA